jgi:hypothetical protein
MKKQILLITISLSYLSFAQSVTKMKDKSIVAQEKRQVFLQWGDWNPKPKYFLGVQTNFAYGQIWGMWAPSRNRDYKNGRDIRPLAPLGYQTQRYSQIALMEDRTKQILENTNQWKEEENNEFLNYTNIVHISDPLFLVYYKPNLNSLENFKSNSTYFKDWGFKKESAFKNASDFGMISHYAQMIEELKDKYNIAKKVDVSRGKRLLMYHDVFIGWRNMKKRIKDLETTFYLKEITKSQLMQWNQSQIPNTGRTDAQIFKDALKQANIF